MRRSNFFTLALLTGLVCYLCFGALVFTYLEHNHEQQLRKDFRERRELFLHDHRNGLGEKDLEAFIGHVMDLHSNKIIPVKNATSPPLWTFGNSLLFATTIVTTVGYGSIGALTPAGRAFSVVYALCGIPLTLLMMGALVERLLLPCKYITEFLETSGRTGAGEKKLYNLLLVGGIFCICFLLIPAAVFDQMEPDWNLLDSLYYCFISLTTIGLGDLVPDGGEMSFNAREWYKVSISFYLLLGICSVLLLLAVFYDVPQFNLGGYFLLSSDLENVVAGATESVTVYMSCAEKERLFESIYGRRIRKFTM